MRPKASRAAAKGKGPAGNAAHAQGRLVAGRGGPSGSEWTALPAAHRGGVCKGRRRVPRSSSQESPGAATPRSALSPIACSALPRALGPDIREAPNIIIDVFLKPPRRECLSMRHGPLTSPRGNEALKEAGKPSRRKPRLFV